MIRHAPPKHPQSSKWYWLEWPAEELQKATITDSSWTVPEGLVLDAQEHFGFRVGLRVSGGVEGQNYEVTNQIITDNSETLHESMIIRCRASGH